MNQSPVQPTARPADREPKPVESDAPVHGPRPGMVFGIKARLFLAFAGMAALTVLAGLVAWYVFGEVGQSVTRITAGSVPAISLSRRFAEIATICSRGKRKIYFLNITKL